MNTNPHYLKFKSSRSFHDKMEKILFEYQEYLLLVKSDGTAVSHYTIIYEFINYLYNYHLVTSVDQITVSMANSSFAKHYRSQNKEAIDSETLKQILKGFFTFIYGKYDMKNEKLMKGFERKAFDK